MIVLSSFILSSLSIFPCKGHTLSFIKLPNIHEIKDGLYLTAMNLTKVLIKDLSKTFDTKCM